MKELKFEKEIMAYSKSGRVKLLEEIKQMIYNYNYLCDVIYKIIEKETNRDKVAQILCNLLGNKADVRNLKAENCIDVDFLNGTVYTIAFYGEIEVLQTIEYIDFNGFIWNMSLEEYKKLKQEIKWFLGE